MVETKFVKRYKQTQVYIDMDCHTFSNRNKIVIINLAISFRSYGPDLKLYKNCIFFNCVKFNSSIYKDHVGK
jgi:hypothetical protein